jgi:murein DD-endopeptidase
MALYAATGLLIRTSADDLFKRVFTLPNPSKKDIRAMFFVTKKNKRHGDRMVAAGTAVHVAGIITDGIIMNSQEPYAQVRRIIDVSDWFQLEGHEGYVRGLDRTALARLAGAGKMCYGLDKEFSRYFEMGAM